MPNIILKKENEIFIDVARGKRSLSDIDNHRIQQAQKGNTCWYYALNPLRFHFGKKSELKERQIEKIFSEYRHGFNKIDNLIQSYLNDLANIEETLNIAKDENSIITIKIVKEALDTLVNQANEFKLEFDINADEFKLYHAFISQNECDNIENYIETLQHQQQIELCQKTLAKLVEYVDINLDSIFEEYTEKLKQSVEDPIGVYANTIDEFAEFPMQKKSIYTRIINNLAAECYGLEEATWDPNESIEKLASMLEIYGPHLVHTIPSVIFNQKDCVSHQSIPGWTVCYPKQFQTNEPDSSALNDEEVENVIEGHAILIVGVKKEKDGDYIYFVDPNDASLPQENRIAYKIPYQYLCSRLTNIYGVNLTELDVDKVNGPFAYRAPLGRYDQIYDFVTVGKVPAEFIKEPKNDANVHLDDNDNPLRKKRKKV